mmetsp:Transcript_3194/g.11565  ORF Transcript_3194/g.11565 Transcript_3194/m.11565 type:complete len:259 (-) Transcript_3194:5540-6316(-)
MRAAKAAQRMAHAAVRCQKIASASARTGSRSVPRSTSTAKQRNAVAMTARRRRLALHRQRITICFDGRTRGVTSSRASATRLSASGLHPWTRHMLSMILTLVVTRKTCRSGACTVQMWRCTGDTAEVRRSGELEGQVRTAWHPGGGRRVAALRLQALSENRRRKESAVTQDTLVGSSSSANETESCAVSPCRSLELKCMVQPWSRRPRLPCFSPCLSHLAQLDSGAHGLLPPMKVKMAATKVKLERKPCSGKRRSTIG